MKIDKIYISSHPIINLIHTIEYTTDVPAWRKGGLSASWWLRCPTPGLLSCWAGLAAVVYVRSDEHDDGLSLLGGGGTLWGHWCYGAVRRCKGFLVK